MEGEEAVMNEHDKCPKCQCGLLFKDGEKLHCLICGYAEIPQKSKKSKPPKASGSLGKYMQEYQSIHPRGPDPIKTSIANMPVTLAPKHTCRHCQDDVTIGPYVIWLSEFPEGNWKRERPDLGVYMAEPWLSRAGRVITNGVPLETGAAYDIIYIRWADRGTIEPEALVPVIAKIIEYLKAGKKVEIGCFGGHGRTGTVAACLLGIVEGISGEDAIVQLRTRYCDHTVEGKAQEQFVIRFCEEFRKFLV